MTGERWKNVNTQLHRWRALRLVEQHWWSARSSGKYCHVRTYASRSVFSLNQAEVRQ